MTHDRHEAEHVELTRQELVDAARLTLLATPSGRCRYQLGFALLVMFPMVPAIVASFLIADWTPVAAVIVVAFVGSQLGFLQRFVLGALSRWIARIVEKRQDLPMNIAWDGEHLEIVRGGATLTMKWPSLRRFREYGSVVGFDFGENLWIALPIRSLPLNWRQGIDSESRDETDLNC